MPHGRLRRPSTTGPCGLSDQAFRTEDLLLSSKEHGHHAASMQPKRGRLGMCVMVLIAAALTFAYIAAPVAFDFKLPQKWNEYDEAAASAAAAAAADAASQRHPSSGYDSIDASPAGMEAPAPVVELSPKIAEARYSDVYGTLRALLQVNHLMLIHEDKLVWQYLNANGVDFNHTVIAEGIGALHRALLPGERLDGIWSTVWAIILSEDSLPKLVNIVTEGPQTGEILRGVYLPITSVADMAQFGDTIFIASESGDVVVVHYPEMTSLGIYQFGSGLEVSGIHPLCENSFWVIFDDDGKSTIAKVVIWGGQVSMESERRLPGTGFRHLVKWGDIYLVLDAGLGSLVALTDLDDTSSDGDVSGMVVWQDPTVSVKELLVINDIAFIGVTKVAEEVPSIAFFDLTNMEELGRKGLSDNGVLHSISAAHLDAKSSYQSIEMKSDLLMPLVEKGDDSKPWQVMLGKVDVGPLLALFDELGDEIWSEEGQATNAFYGEQDGTCGKWCNVIKENKERKPGMDNIPLIFANAVDELYFKFPWWEKYFEPVVQPLVDQILEPILGIQHSCNRISKMQFDLMRPGSLIYGHTDSGPWADNSHRIHIPITLNDGVSLYLQDLGWQHEALPVYLGVGEAFELDNKLTHNASNEGTEPRIHLIFDLLNEPVDAYHYLKPGQTCDLTTDCIDEGDNILH
mmetsp:Transcript_11717/g.29875  ORF Transcript_11717/g.29875 Transcript_11717/m.29875 type:complete len:686 (-) Transcript_11717:164-2221(-)